MESGGDYWDRVAWEKRFSHPVDFKRLEPLAPRLGRVVEVGCGYGRVLAALVEAGWSDAIGFDAAGEMIARGRLEHPGLDLRHHPPGPLPLEEESVDLVLLFAILTCIPGTEDQHALVAEAGRLLVPGGLLYVSDLWLQEDGGNRARYEEGLRAGYPRGVFPHPEGLLLRHHTRSHVKDLFAAFERVDLVTLEVATMNGNGARAFQYFGRKPVPRSGP